MSDKETDANSSAIDSGGTVKLDQRLCEAFKNRDLDAVMACFWDNPDLMVVLNGDVCRGTEAVRTAFQQLFDSHESIGLEVNEVSHVKSGDGILGVGTATYELKPVEGQSRLLVERWSDLRRKIDGKWVFVLDHTTHLPD